MTTPPDRPKIYHITHVDNLPSIVTNGYVYPDAPQYNAQRHRPTVAIGMSEIKKRRMSLPVACHQGDVVADYVPFYFCPRSIMLYLLHRGNHVDLAYRSGQEPIVHLEADLHEVAAWAQASQRRWAFSLSNAGARYTPFRNSLDCLDELNWQAIQSADFRQKEIKEGKQAEFLFHGPFPWELVNCVGAATPATYRRARAAITGTRRPTLEITPDWYY